MTSMAVIIFMTKIAITSKGAEITSEKDLLTTTQGILYRYPALISTEYYVNLVNPVKFVFRKKKTNNA